MGKMEEEEIKFLKKEGFVEKTTLTETTYMSKETKFGEMRFFPGLNCGYDIDRTLVCGAFEAKALKDSIEEFSKIEAHYHAIERKYAKV